mgnify:FL=1
MNQRRYSSYPLRDRNDVYSRKTSYRQYRQQFPLLGNQNRRKNENVLSFDKLFIEHDILPPIKDIEVKEGWVKLSRDKNNRVIKKYGKFVNEPEIIERLKLNEEKNELILKIKNLNKNIEKSKQCDENRFIPLDRLKYENSFNNDDLLDDTDVIEEVETSDSEGEDY